jgi:hypothetical protein
LRKSAKDFESVILTGDACSDDIDVLSFLTNICVSGEGKPATALCTVPILAAELLYALRADFTVSQVLQPDVQPGAPPNIVVASAGVVITRDLLDLACAAACVGPLVKSYRELSRVHESYRLKADMFLFLCSKSPEEHDQYCMVEQDSRQSAGGPSATIEIADPASNYNQAALVKHPNPELLAFELFATFPGQSQRMCSHCAHYRMQSFMQAQEIVVLLHLEEISGLTKFAAAELDYLSNREMLSAMQTARAWLHAVEIAWPAVPFSRQTTLAIILETLLGTIQGITDVIRLISTTLAAQSIDDLMCRDDGLEALAERPRCVDAWGVFYHLNVELWYYSPITMPLRCSQPQKLADCVQYIPNSGRGALQDTCQDCCHAQSLQWLARAQVVLGHVLQEPRINGLISAACSIIDRVSKLQNLQSEQASVAARLAKFCLDARSDMEESLRESSSLSEALLAGPGVESAQQSCLASPPRPQGCSNKQTCSAEFLIGEGLGDILQSDNLKRELVKAIITDVRFGTGLPADQMAVALLRIPATQTQAQPTTLVSVTLQAYVKKTCIKRLKFVQEVVGSKTGLHLFETRKVLMEWAEAGWWVPTSEGINIALSVAPSSSITPATGAADQDRFPFVPVLAGAAGCLLLLAGALAYAKSVKRKRVFIQP